MDIIERLTLEAAQADTMIACEHRHRYQFAAGLVAGLRVLDLCCGSGYGSVILAEHAETVTGVDNDVATIDTAQVTLGESTTNLSFEVADAIAYLDADLQTRFDAIVCFEGLEHLPDLERTLALLRRHADHGVRIVASVPNDKLSDIHNPFHVTTFGYDEALQAFAEFPSVVLVPQYLAEGSLICPVAATEIDVSVELEDRNEPEYANHFIFCVGFEPAAVERVHHGRIQLNTSPVFNRWSEDLKRGAAALRRENARLGRARLGQGGSAAASALAAVQAREAQIAALQARCDAADARVSELEAALATVTEGFPQPVAEQDAPLSLAATFEAVEAQPVVVPDDEDPNSWEHRHRRAAEVMIPWIEQTVPLEGKTVLEYGCGNAAVSCALAERGAHVVGYDIDQGWLDEARTRLAERGVAGVELELHPPATILDAVARRRGEVDVFLLYAVLEHLTVQERLDVLRVAREVVKPDGAIVVCETPNRLTYLDHHTAQMPFFHLLPDELALDYYQRSARADFKVAIDAALREGRDAGLEAIARWGRGVSFHEFEVAFDGNLDQHVIASNYDTLLFRERPVHVEEVVLARYLSRIAPNLAPVWSRCWLDLILSPAPAERRAPFLRPWTADTIESTSVGWTGWENLLLKGPDARLWITLPTPTRRVVVGSATLDGRWLSLYLRPESSERSFATSHRAAAGRHGFTTFELDAPARRFALTADDECYVVFVGYEE